MKGKAHSGHSMLLTLNRKCHNAKHLIEGLQLAPRSLPERASAPTAAAFRATFRDSTARLTSGEKAWPRQGLYRKWIWSPGSESERRLVYTSVSAKWPVPQHETIQASCCQGVIPTCLSHTTRNTDFRRNLAYPGLQHLHKPRGITCRPDVLQNLHRRGKLQYTMIYF